MNLKPYKTTFRINASSKNRLNDIQRDIMSRHSKHITRTELINISLNEFLGNIKNPEDIDQYLIKYNLL